MGRLGHRAAAWLAAVLALSAAPALSQESGAPPATQQASSVGLSSLETDHLTLLYYDPIQTYLTPYIARAYENSFAFHHRMFDWTPWDKPTIYLRDLRDSGQAVVRETPNNVITVDVAPFPMTYETWSPGERFFTLMNHELAHIASTDLYNERDAFWRRIFFGKPNPIAEHPESILYNFLAAPRTMGPRWYYEGSAVFLETWMGGGLGRAQGGYDEMVFRAMVRDNAHFYDPLGLESEGVFNDFQIGANDYLYGTRFFSYLALTYGPQSVMDWLKRGPDSERYYEAQFEHVFHRPLDDVWGDWIKFEHDFQQKNLASVQQFPATPVQRYEAHGLGNMSRGFYDPKTDSLIVGLRYPGVIAHLSVLNLRDGSERRLTNIKGPALYRVTNLAYDPDRGVAYYTTDNNAYRDLMETNVATGETHMLIRDGRTGEFALNPIDKSLWGIRHLNGITTLVRSGDPHTEWNLVYTFPYGHELFDLDISPDGQFMSASVGEINGDQRIEVYRIADLLAGNVTPVAKMERGSSVPEGGVFSPDGRYLYATSYYTGVSNVYRLELATGKIEAVSNASTGFFRPIPMADGSLIVYEFTGAGMSPVRIDPKPLDDLGTIKFLGTEVANAHPEVKTWGVGSPSRIPLDSIVTNRGQYEPLHELRLQNAYPIVMGYKRHPGLGGYVLWEDPLGFDGIAVNVGYSPRMGLPAKEDIHADISFHTLYWHFGYWHNKASFYDLFGPTDNSRKGDSVFAGYSNVIIYDPPQQLTFNADVQLYAGLDTLPGAQNVAADDRNMGTVKLGLTYTNVDQSLGAVDYEAGYRANFNLQGDYAHDDAYPKVRVGFDFGFQLPWKHASFWMYNSAGAAGGRPENTLGYFYFGAYGNNFVDAGEIKRYRNFDSFPGFTIDAISARNFAKSVAELNLPPVRFSDVGVPAFFLSSVRSAVFASAMVAQPGHGPAKTFENVGFQLDWNFTVAVRLPMTLSMGYAHGFGDHDRAGGRRDEVMLSLKIM